MTFRDYTKYEVFEDGRIWSYSKNKFLKYQTNHKGYKRVTLTDNEGKQKTYLVHRIVYETFSGSPIPNNLQCNHINEDKSDCRFCNINLMTPRENVNWGSRNERSAKSQSKKVGAFKNNELIMSFQSTQEAGRNGFNSGNVSRCCNGVKYYKTYKGYTWRYL